VSLATFYVFDKENAGKPQLGEQLARGLRDRVRERLRERLCERLRRLRLLFVHRTLPRLLDGALSDHLDICRSGWPGL
jgi:hypothetical protein